MPSYVITGASRGIGLEFVHQLSDVSSNEVFALVRNASTATFLAPLSTRPNVHVVEADTTSIIQLKKAAQTVASITGGSLDVLIANAGGPLGKHTSLANTDIDQEELGREIAENYESNVTSVVFTNNAFLPLLRNGVEKKIIDISSGLADPEATLASGFEHFGGYSLAKAALSFAVAKYAAELAKEKFTVIALAPGLVNTHATSTEPPPSGDLLKILQSIDRWKKHQPEWDGKQISVQDSVQKQLKVIASVGPKDSGKFISQNGDKRWM